MAFNDLILTVSSYVSVAQGGLLKHTKKAHLLRLMYRAKQHYDHYAGGGGFINIHNWAPGSIATIPLLKKPGSVTIIHASTL